MLANIQKLFPYRVDGVAIVELARGREPPGMFPHRAIGALEQRSQAGNRQLFSVPFHRLGTDDLVIFVAKFTLLDEKRDVYLAEDSCLGLHLFQRNRESLRNEPRFQELLLERLVRLFQVRIHVVEEGMVLPFGFSVGRIDGCGYHEPRIDLVNHFRETGPILQE